MSSNPYESHSPLDAPLTRETARGPFRLALGLVLGMVVFGAVMRLVPHPPNFTPMTAIALFAGAHFSRKLWAFAIPLAAMLLSDSLLFLVFPGRGLHLGMPFVYAALAAIVGIGLVLSRHRRPLPVLGGALAGSLLFFFVSNLGFWLVYDFYPKTWDGLAACYVAAIPFYRNMLPADLAFTAVLFGSFALAARRLPAHGDLQPAREVK